ncbi:MAG TPA: hypothetical protein PLK55_03640 [archaeon]|jgi:uncharacterized protein YlxW (UPF0749 family)|nr:hypothetical protein [archaeon]
MPVTKPAGKTAQSGTLKRIIANRNLKKLELRTERDYIKLKAKLQRLQKPTPKLQEEIDAFHKKMSALPPEIRKKIIRSKK